MLFNRAQVQKLHRKARFEHIHYRMGSIPHQPLNISTFGRQAFYRTGFLDENQNFVAPK